MPKVNHGPGTNIGWQQEQKQERNPPPPPPPPPTGEPSAAPKEKKPSFAWRAFKFVAIAAAGGIVTTLAVDKFKQWTNWGKGGEEDEERNPGTVPGFGGPGMGQMPMMPGVTAFPVPWPMAPPQIPAPAPVASPEPQRRKRNRKDEEAELSPDEIYEQELQRFLRAKARKKAHEDFERIDETDELEDLMHQFEEYGLD